MHRIAVGGQAFDRRQRGTLAHEAVGLLAAGGSYDPAAIAATVDVVIPTDWPAIHRRSLRLLLTGILGTYAHRLRPLGWDFLGREVIVGGVKLDLLWGQRRLVMAQELKLADDFSPDAKERAVEQASFQLQECRARWGNTFHGVQVAPLLSPRDAVWVKR